MDPLAAVSPSSLVAEIQALQGAWVHGAITLLREAGYSRLNPPGPQAITYALTRAESALAAAFSPSRRRRVRATVKGALVRTPEGSMVVRWAPPPSRRPRRVRPALEPKAPVTEPSPPGRLPNQPPAALPPFDFSVVFRGGRWHFSDHRTGKTKVVTRLRDLVRRTIIPLGLGSQWDKHPLGIQP